MGYGSAVKMAEMVLLGDSSLPYVSCGALSPSIWIRQIKTNLDGLISH
jgi:hypothetical protein